MVVESENWELDFEWLATRHKVKEMMNLDNLPDLQAMLFLIGVQELGQVRDEFSKEEKQDLIHIATCRLLSYDGYYDLQGYDDEGWPHWRLIETPAEKGVKNQELLLKRKMIQYFNYLDQM